MELKLNAANSAILVLPIKDTLLISIGYKPQDIRQVESIKYVGVIDYESLNWRPHIDYVVTKGVHAMGMLRKLINRRYRTKR